MDAKKRIEMLTTLNITVVALVALVAIVGLTAIVLNGPGMVRSRAAAMQEQPLTGNAVAGASPVRQDDAAAHNAVWQPFSDASGASQSYRAACFDRARQTYYDC